MGVPTRVAVAAVGLLCFATLLVFAPLREAAFLNYDDTRHVTDNGAVRAGLTWRGLVWAFTNREFNWHPLTWLSHMLDCELFGLDPAAHHLSSVVLHATNAGLLLFALWRLTGALWPSAFAAALFALHPLHVEPVAWVSARPHLIGAFLWFAALLAYARFTQRRTAGRYAVLFGLMLLDLFNRGLLVTLPFVLLLLDYWPLGRWTPSAGRAGAWPLVREKVPLLGVSLAMVAVQVAIKSHSGALRSLEQVPLAVRAANALRSVAVYLGKTLWPADLAIFYPLAPRLPPAAEIAAGAAVLLAGTVLALRVGRRRPYAVTGWLWYLVVLLPVSGLVQIGDHAMADRYTYVALIGPFVVLAWAAADAGRAFPALRRVLPLGAAAVLVLCAAGSRRQIGYWRDSVTVLEHALAVAPDNPVVEINLGVALKALGRNEEARAHYAAALRVQPDNVLAHNNLAAVLFEMGDLAGAEEHLRASLRLLPAFAGARLNLGAVLLRRGEAAAAREQFAAVVEAQPGSGLARLGLAQALEAEGRSAEALEEYGRSVRLDPAGVEGHFRYGVALAAAGRREEAVAELRKALRLDPRHEAALAELARLGAGPA